MRRVSAGGGVGSAPVAAGKNGTIPARDCVACADKFKQHSGGQQLRPTTTFGRFDVIWCAFGAFFGPVCRVGLVGLFKDV